MRTPKRRKDKVDKWNRRPDPEWPERERSPHGQKRKDTRHNCKGRPGVAHEWEEVVLYEWTHVTWYLDKCVNCGRHGKMRSDRVTPEPPDR